MAGQRAIDHRRQALAAEVVDHHQHPQTTAVAQHIRREVEAPALVRCLRIVMGARVPSARLRPARLLSAASARSAAAPAPWARSRTSPPWTASWSPSSPTKTRDALGRDYYEHGAGPGQGWRHGVRPGLVEYAAPQIGAATLRDRQPEMNDAGFEVVHDAGGRVGELGAVVGEEPLRRARGRSSGSAPDRPRSPGP